MAKREETEKQPKRRSRVGLVLLIILLLLAGTVGFIYYSASKAPVAVDDPRQMADLKPMGAQERFRFFAADQSVQMKVGSADIWNFVLTHAGEDFLNIINEELSAYSLSVSGCGIQLDEKGPQLNLELFYEDIRVVAKVPCALEASGQHFTLRPAGIKVGVIPLPVSDLLSSVKIEFDLQLPVISSVTGISYENNAILINGTMKEDLRSLISPEQTMYRIALFNDSLQPLAEAVATEDGYAVLLSHLEQNPGDVESLYREMFVLAGSKLTDAYLDDRMDLTQRVLPGIDFSSLEAARTELSQQMDPRNAILDRFFTSVVSDYNGKVFKLSDGEFLKKLKPFHATNYGTGSYDEMFAVLNPDDFFLVLVDVEDGFIRKTPSFDRLADENQQFTQPVDFNKTYILGCVFRSVDGSPYLLYETETNVDNADYRNLTLQPLSEAEVSALQVPGKFGVWTGK